MDNEEFKKSMMRAIDGLAEMIQSGRVHQLVIAIDISGEGTVIRATPCPDAQHFSELVDKITHALHAAVSITSGKPTPSDYFEDDEPGLPPGGTPH